MESTIALLGLSLFTALATAQPQAIAHTPHYQLDCQVFLHQADGRKKLLAEPHLSSIAGRPAQFVSGGTTGAGKPFGTVCSFLATPKGTNQVQLQADLELSKHVGDGVVETIVHFPCDREVELGKPIHLEKQDPRNPKQHYRATFRLTEVRPAY
jgi:hypothetical protein